MRENVMFVAVDVDDKSYHVAMRAAWDEELIEFRCKPNAKDLVRKLVDKKRIESLALEGDYCSRVRVLKCFRGIETITAMTILTEIGDIRRFDHPRRLTSYAGLDIIEYSSGGDRRQYGISKAGNRFLRNAIVESSQYAFAPIIVSNRLSTRRAGLEPCYIEVADKCMERLHSKGTRLLYAGKPKNKVKVACAREFLGFLWETLQLETKAA